ncbi:MAG: YkvI family membrane protein [Desulfotomaculales bacterium]
MRHLAAVGKVVALYAGAVIGAGFASGKEIMQFFVLFGPRALPGTLLTTVLFAYLGAVVLGTATGVQSTSYRGVIARLLGSRLGTVKDVVSLVVLFGGLGVMLAGSGAVLQQQFGLPPEAGVLGLAVLTCLVIYRGLAGVIEVNAVIVPVKVVTVAGICLCSLLWSRGAAPAAGDALPGGGCWWVAAILYVSYNLIIPVAVLASVGRSVPRAAGMAGALAGGLILGGTAALMTAALAAYMPGTGMAQVPMLYLAGMIHPALAGITSVIIWLAIFTTAVAEAHGLAARLAAPGTARYRLYGIGAVIAALPATCAGFPELVRLFYPLFGYAGLLLLIPLSLTPLAGIRHRIKKTYRHGRWLG